MLAGPPTLAPARLTGTRLAAVSPRLAGPVESRPGQLVPLQLLAYHTALARGTDVDKPRNLAKSVTVE